MLVDSRKISAPYKSFTEFKKWSKNCKAVGIPITNIFYTQSETIQYAMMRNAVVTFCAMTNQTLGKTVIILTKVEFEFYNLFKNILK